MTKSIKIATWNVNSVRARLPRVIAWLQKASPDLVCVQETKVEDALFPRDAFEQIGYRCEIFGQKTYNGVALLSKEPCEDVRRGFPNDAEGQRRLIDARFHNIRVVNVYVPNGESVESEKFTYKREWLAKLETYLRENCDFTKPVLLCGDFNIAPEDRDVHDPERWRGKVLFHPDEHAALAKIKGLGLKDTFRKFHEESGLFSWWDYRMGAFPRGWGLRIDLILMNELLQKNCVGVEIDREERKGTQPSDHAPVVAEINI